MYMHGYICYRPLNISYQSINVGLWPKIEGFCHLHAELMVIFLKYLLLAVTQQCSAKVIYIGQCFFKYCCTNNAQFFLTRSMLNHL